MAWNTNPNNSFCGFRSSNQQNFGNSNPGFNRAPPPGFSNQAISLLSGPPVFGGPSGLGMFGNQPPPPSSTAAGSMGFGGSSVSSFNMPKNFGQFGGPTQPSPSTGFGGYGNMPTTNPHGGFGGFSGPSNLPNPTAYGAPTNFGTMAPGNSGSGHGFTNTSNFGGPGNFSGLGKGMSPTGNFNTQLGPGTMPSSGFTGPTGFGNQTNSSYSGSSGFGNPSQDRNSNSGVAAFGPFNQQTAPNSGPATGTSSGHQWRGNSVTWSDSVPSQQNNQWNDSSNWMRQSLTPSQQWGQIVYSNSNYINPVPTFSSTTPHQNRDPMGIGNISMQEPSAQQVEAALRTLQRAWHIKETDKSTGGHISQSPPGFTPLQTLPGIPMWNNSQSNAATNNGGQTVHTLQHATLAQAQQSQ